MHARNVIAHSLCGRGHQAEAVPLGGLLHEEALFGLTSVRNVGVPQGRLFPSGLCLSAISRVVWAWPDPTNKVSRRKIAKISQNNHRRI